MATSLYFYDLETSGVNPRTARIMQYAGQRTDMQLRPIGEPDDIMIAMTEDVLPEPDAILITGITPQHTRADGITELELLKYFHEHIAIADTVFVGFNNIRFDDEFMRFTQYRNFFDAYEWSWKNGCSRWDVLDVVRMTRALRPEGIAWPFDSSGKPSNRLELLTAVNELDHLDAHNALSDVQATISVARMIYNKQPRLFEYLLKLRDKTEVKKLANGSQPFVYTSGKYPSAYQKTTVVSNLGEHPVKQGVLVFDLRADPRVIADKKPAELATIWRERVEDETKRFPVKTLQFNRCPAIAPLSVLESSEAAQANIKIDLSVIKQHHQHLKALPHLYQNLTEALKIMDQQTQSSLVAAEQAVDGQLYDGFIGDQDRTAMSVVRAAGKDDIGSLDIQFKDDRLNKLLPLYKARNFAQLLTTEERQAWEAFRKHKLLDGGDKSLASRYFNRISELANNSALSNEQRFILEELQLYGESILPSADF